MGDLDEALRLSTEAVSAISTENPWRAPCLMNLGTWLFTKYEVDGDKNHLELALSHSKEAVGLVHSNQLGRGTYLEHLGGMLSQGYKKAGERGDLEKSDPFGCRRNGGYATQTPQFATFTGSPEHQACQEIHD